MRVPSASLSRMTGMKLQANAHIHLPPNFSAFESVEQAVSLAASQGLAVLGASNYYDYTVYADFARLAAEQFIYPLYGIEIIALLPNLQAEGVKLNDPGNPGKMYICGKGISQFAPMSAEAASLLDVIRQKDSARMAAMANALAHIFRDVGIDTGLDEAAVKSMVVKRHGCPGETVYIQERHIAQAFQESLFELVSTKDRSATLERLFSAPAKSAPDDAVAVQYEIRSQLLKAGKPAYVEETFVDLDHAYRLILALGGIPCYPVLADGANPICEFEADIERLIAQIQSRGIFAAELIPIRNSPEVLSRYVSALRGRGLVVTAGTEHNTLDLLPMEPACLNGEPIPDQVREVFWEGACVVAAHQEKSRLGETGFVDSEGYPNSDYNSFEDRISAFMQFGEAAIRRATKNVE